MIVALPLRFVCAWCQRVRTGQGRWERVDPADPRQASASHGICPDCLERETRVAATESAWP
jgi:hypothetical protein